MILCDTSSKHILTGTSPALASPSTRTEKVWKLGSAHVTLEKADEKNLCKTGAPKQRGIDEDCAQAIFRKKSKLLLADATILQWVINTNRQFLFIPLTSKNSSYTKYKMMCGLMILWSLKLQHVVRLYLEF